MSIYNSDDFIVACSSGNTSNSAIAIIRISGKSFLSKLNHFFDRELSQIKPRYATFCKFVHYEKIIDEIVLTYFEGPNSYNGEDILELSVHGNQLNVKRIIDLVCEIDGFRHAEAGEFTYRALINNKLSLTQVEGLDLLLNANTIFSLDQGFSLMSGKLQANFNKLYDSFINHKSSLEFGFDFLEDMGEERFNQEFDDSFLILKKCVLNLYSHVSNQSFNLIKPEVAIFGLPNAGKSTLFNRVLKDDRAIVSATAGTTRDYLREDIVIEGNLFTLIDTAGIRSSNDSIEGVGIKKGIDIISKSFFKILLINPFEFNSDYYSKVSEISFDVLLFTHSDQDGFNESSIIVLDKLKDIFSFQIGPIEPILLGSIEPKSAGPIEPESGGPIEPESAGPIEPKSAGSIEPKSTGPIEPKSIGPIEPRSVSLMDDSIDVEQYLFREIHRKYLKILDFDPVVLERHGQVIKSIYSLFLQYELVKNSQDDMAILSSELNIVGHCISELIGIVSPDDVLHNIFDNFCIGK